MMVNILLINKMLHLGITKSFHNSDCTWRFLSSPALCAESSRAAPPRGDVYSGQFNRFQLHLFRDSDSGACEVWPFLESDFFVVPLQWCVLWRPWLRWWLGNPCRRLWATFVDFTASWPVMARWDGWEQSQQSPWRITCFKILDGTEWVFFSNVVLLARLFPTQREWFTSSYYVMDSF